MGVYLLLSYLPILNGRTYRSAYNILILNSIRAIKMERTFGTVAQRCGGFDI
jgi:hypothetical protein